MAIQGSSSKSSRLAAYRDKRNQAATPEPFGDSGLERPGVFVVQLHAARNLHYDLRLEVGGVLKSWALPKGPSLDPAEKRAAFATEDHPIEYADFEGVIPEGNYGAGAMIVWDRGLAIPHIDHADGLRDGKLLFELRGYKLRGLFTLVKTKEEKAWLLIKKPDNFAVDTPTEALEPGSVLSGLTVEEMGSGSTRAQALRHRLLELGAERQRVDPAAVRVALCEPCPEPFSGKNWFFEIKYDGYRLVLAKEPAVSGQGRHRRRSRRGGRCFFRSGMESTVAFPDLVRAVSALPFESLVLDGEVVVLDDGGLPNFHRLQQRARLTRPLDVERASIALPAVYFAFDLLGFEDFDLRPLPFEERKALLLQLLPRAGPLRYVEALPERGESFFEGVRHLGLEGMVAKRAGTPYRTGRTGDWRKVRAEETADFAVVGYRLPEGTRHGFRGLHLAALDGGRMVSVGRVGSGFSQDDLRTLRGNLDALGRPEPAFVNPDGSKPGGPRDVWVEPTLVAEVRYKEISPKGNLRHPSFLRLRDDKRPEDCLLPGAAQAEEPEVVEREEAPRPEVAFTNLGKVFWPTEGYTKGDLIQYYRTIAPWLLPYLRDRPLVLDRYPDGIGGKSFFQKNAPDFAPDWIRTEIIWSEETGEETLYFVADHLETLLYLVNLGTIPIHLRSSRMGRLEQPDWCVLDLDAKDATFEQVIEVALGLRTLCDTLGLPSFPKTSGATGLHLLLPLSEGATHQQARMLGEVLARLIATRLPEAASVHRLPQHREGKVYVDFLQNGYGKLLVSPFSARPRPGATVSMPLRWDEVGPGLSPEQFTIANAVERMESLGEDPLQGLFEPGPPLAEVLGRLSGELEG